MAVLAADWADPAAACAGAGGRLLSGLAISITKGFAAAVPALKGALSDFRAESGPESMSGEDALRWLWLACQGSEVCCWPNSHSPLARLVVTVGMPSNSAVAPSLKVWLPLIQVALALNVGFTSSSNGASKNDAVLPVGNAPPPEKPGKR